MIRIMSDGYESMSLTQNRQFVFAFDFGHWSLLIGLSVGGTEIEVGWRHLKSVKPSENVDFAYALSRRTRPLVLNKGIVKRVLSVAIWVASFVTLCRRLRRSLAVVHVTANPIAYVRGNLCLVTHLAKVVTRAWLSTRSNSFMSTADSKSIECVINAAFVIAFSCQTDRRKLLQRTVRCSTPLRTTKR